MEYMNKKRGILRFLLYVSIIPFIIAFVLSFFNLPLLFWIVTWIAYLFFTIIVIHIVRNYFLDNRDKVKGRAFEMFFFLFLFMASYSITLIVADWFKPIMTIAFIISVVSSGYFGYMHYIDGLFNEKYTTIEKERKPKK